MSFVAKLFGGDKAQAMATPAPPRIGDAIGEGAARELRYRSKKQLGVDDTMLTGNVGSSGNGSPPKMKTMLG